MKIKAFKSIEFLAKGKRSEVYKALYKNQKVAIKLFKTQDSKKRAKKEANFILILNKENIGPKLIFQENNYIVYKLIEGPRFIDWLNQSDKKSTLKMISKILDVCYKIDKLGINKLELHNPKKHILIENNKPILIDFERCYFTDNPKNLTQFCQYLISKKIQYILKSKKIKIKRVTLISVLKKYKVNKNTNFKIILKHIESS